MTPTFQRPSGGRVLVCVGVMVAILALLVVASQERAPEWAEHGRVVCPAGEPCYFEDRRFYVEPEPAPAEPELGEHVQIAGVEGWIAAGILGAAAVSAALYFLGYGIGRRIGKRELAADLLDKFERAEKRRREVAADLLDKRAEKRRP